MQVGSVTCEASSTIHTSKRRFKKIALRRKRSVYERDGKGGAELFLDSLIDSETGCRHDLGSHQLVVNLRKRLGIVVESERERVEAW